MKIILSLKTKINTIAMYHICVDADKIEIFKKNYLIVLKKLSISV